MKRVADSEEAVVPIPRVRIVDPVHVEVTTIVVLVHVRRVEVAVVLADRTVFVASEAIKITADRIISPLNFIWGNKPTSSRHQVIFIVLDRSSHAPYRLTDMNSG